MRMRLKRLGLPLLILGSTAALIVLIIATRPRLVPVAKPEHLWPVETVTARFADHQPWLVLYGEIVAGRRSELRPQVAGEVIEIGPGLHEGASVRQGELLLRIDPFDYATALAEQRALLAEAEASLAKLERDLARTERLYQEKNVSEQALDDARLAVIQQQALLEQRRIAVQRAERDLADTRLRAPFDGVLANVNADVGKRITDFGSELVAELIDTSQLEVRFNLSNAQFGRLRASGEPLLGRAVDVTWEVGDQRVAYPASIARLGPEIDATTGGVTVYATIDTAGRQIDLRPGAFVSVRLLDRVYPSSVSVPDTALYGADQVYVVVDERLQARKIRILGRTGQALYIDSAGEPPIREGDLIVTTQLSEAGPGAKVALR